MRVLITGAAGFIGSNLARKCLDAGWHVDGVDDMSNGHLGFVPSEMKDDDNKTGTFSMSDFSSVYVFDRVKAKEYDVVFHLAAQPRVSYSVEQPFLTNDTNVSKTLRLMEVCKGSIKRFVFASSSAIYGNTDNLPTQEFQAKNPQSPYGLQKSIIEDYLKMFGRLYELDSVSLRFFNVFGPNQLGDSPYSTAVSAWIAAIMKGQSMRSDGDGTQSRDMVHVDNVVHALMLAAQHADPLGGSVFNVGTGRKYTNNEILNNLIDRFPDAKTHSAPARAGDVKHTLADISLISRTLGYKPIVDFWDGLDSTIKWAQENPHLFNET